MTTLQQLEQAAAELAGCLTAFDGASQQASADAAAAKLADGTSAASAADASAAWQAVLGANTAFEAALTDFANPPAPDMKALPHARVNWLRVVAYVRLLLRIVGPGAVPLVESYVASLPLSEEQKADLDRIVEDALAAV